MFTDGMDFETSGEPKILSLKDGLYVVGKGMLIPVDTMDEALFVFEKLESSYR
jgi:hypothetical protein